MQMTTVGLPIWIIYAHPTDYPDHYVARLWDGMTNQATASYLLAPTLDALRLRLPPELYRYLAQHPFDEPHVVETWL
jgi:hypothetical protein